MPASTILLLSSDSAAAEELKAVLAAAGHTVRVTADPDEALGRVGEHGMVIVDRVAGKSTATDICRAIRDAPGQAAIPILCVASNDEVEERIRFLEAGADDVMARPFDARELEARVEALVLRLQRSIDLSPNAADVAVSAPPPPRCVAVFSPKGGVGTTTIATNIATIQARKSPETVVIVDLHLQFGQVATLLNLEVKQSLADLARDEAALRDPGLLRGYVMEHESGLHVIAAPMTPDQSELIEPRHVATLLTTLLASYETVIVDAGSRLDGRTLTTFQHVDSIIVPVQPEISALKAVRSLLDYLAETGTRTAPLRFVLNNMFAREILKLRDVETALGAKVAGELPYEPFVYLKAVNEGVPVVTGAPKSVPADRLTTLAATIFAEGAAMAGASGRPRRRGPRLGTLLRRRA